MEVIRDFLYKRCTGSLKTLKPPSISNTSQLSVQPLTTSVSTAVRASSSNDSSLLPTVALEENQTWLGRTCIPTSIPPTQPQQTYSFGTDRNSSAESLAHLFQAASRRPQHDGVSEGCLFLSDEDLFQEIMVTFADLHVFPSSEACQPAGLLSVSSASPLSGCDALLVDVLHELSPGAERATHEEGMKLDMRAIDATQLHASCKFGNTTYQSSDFQTSSTCLTSTTESMQNHDDISIDVLLGFSRRSTAEQIGALTVPMSTVEPTSKIPISCEPPQLNMAPIPGHTSQPQLPSASDCSKHALHKASPHPGPCLSKIPISTGHRSDERTFNVSDYNLEKDGLYFTDAGIRYVERRNVRPRKTPPKQPAKVRMRRITTTEGLLSLEVAGGVPPSLQLWEFLLHHLELGKHESTLCWTDRLKGVFRFKDPSTFAKLWGAYHCVEAMNYEKMARTMRHYYRRNILEPSNDKLVYKFTKHVMRQVLDYEPQLKRAAGANAEKASAQSK